MTKIDNFKFIKFYTKLLHLSQIKIFDIVRQFGTHIFFGHPIAQLF